MTKILIFGDSIAWGAFDDEEGGWAERLKTHFIKNYNQNDGTGVYNFSVSSNDTRGVLHFLEQDIKKIKEIEDEDLVILFSIGSNDAGYENKSDYFVPIEEFSDNLEKIIKIAKKYSKKIFFTGLTRVDETLTTPWHFKIFWTNKDLQNYDKIIQDLCGKNKLKFIPLLELIKDSDLKDGVHPNSKGHKKIFERVKNYLDKKL